MFLQQPHMHACNKCNKGPSDGVELKKCSGCKCAFYCGTACRDEDWQTHKRYCKRLLFVKQADVKAFVDSRRKANPDGSAVYQAALQAAKDGETDSVYALVTARAAEHFVKACEDDVLPSCETEEKMWGLWGEPRSEGYQRLLWAYQKALKFGDLSAQTLMECLLARPAASKALTRALRKVRFVKTEQDSLESVCYTIDRYMVMADGIEVVSEFDKWPVKEGS